MNLRGNKGSAGPKNLQNTGPSKSVYAGYEGGSKAAPSKSTPAPRKPEPKGEIAELRKYALLT